MNNSTLLLGWRRRRNRRLLHFLSRRARTRLDVEDLAQETYLRVLRARDLSEVRNPQAYLLTIAGHVVAEWHEHQPPRDAGAPLDHEELADECTPEIELDARISQDRLNETLASVSPMMRAVLLLRLRDHRSYREIAQELGLTDRQVKRYLARGYDCLRRILED